MNDISYHFGCELHIASTLYNIKTLKSRAFPYLTNLDNFSLQNFSGYLHHFPAGHLDFGDLHLADSRHLHLPHRIPCLKSHPRQIVIREIKSSSTQGFRQIRLLNPGIISCSIHLIMSIFLLLPYLLRPSYLRSLRF